MASETDVTFWILVELMTPQEPAESMVNQFESIHLLSTAKHQSCAKERNHIIYRQTLRQWRKFIFLKVLRRH